MIPALRPTSVQTSRPRGLWLLVVVLAFWAAQMHGFTHAVSHLGRADVAPHAVLCADCIAAANAGAAPTPAGANLRPALAPQQPTVAVRLRSHAAAPLALYRSRGPPTTA